MLAGLLFECKWVTAVPVSNSMYTSLRMELYFYICMPNNFPWAKKANRNLDKNKYFTLAAVKTNKKELKLTLIYLCVSIYMCLHVFAVLCYS